MGKLKVFSGPYPNWDYLHPSLIQTYPNVMYYFPNDSIESVYTIKIYWDSDQQNGFGLIMDTSKLPHQGVCVNTFTIQSGKIDSESRLYLQESHIAILKDAPMFDSIW